MRFYTNLNIYAFKITNSKFHICIAKCQLLFVSRLYGFLKELNIEDDITFTKVRFEDKVNRLNRFIMVVVLNSNRSSELFEILTDLFYEINEHFSVRLGIQYCY